MKRCSLILLVLTAAMFVAAPFARATVIELHTDLLGSNEVPASGSPATGIAIVDLDTVAQTLTVRISFSGLTSNTVAAHIHCCLPSAVLSGVNVGVATQLPAFPGFPINIPATAAGTGGVTSLLNYVGVLNLTDPLSYNPAFITAQGGLAQAEGAFIAGLTSYRTYLNVHTVNFPGGEIRGFLVPEPGTIGLLALGLGAGLIFRRRRRI